jgi:DNA polymerase III delta prime subunit
MELYKKYRPTRFSTVIGCSDVIATLKKKLGSKAGLPHVILFHGPTGCGKTTLARILAKELECEGLDFSEMNSASYRGIDSIRNMDSISRLHPMGKCKVWILDEVHKMTSDAQHASLKLFEDTPRLAYFFLCTTNPEKLIKPLRNRCTELRVPSLSREELGELLDRVTKAEKIEVPKKYRDELIISAEGSARRLLTTLDRLQGIDESEWELALSEPEVEPEVMDLARALLNPKSHWSAVGKMLRGITLEPESVRHAVLGYMGAVLCSKRNDQAYRVIEAFRDPLFDCGKPGLISSAYEALNGGD